MTNGIDDPTSGDAELERLLADTSGAAADRPMPEVLLELANVSRQLLSCGYAALTTIDHEGRSEFYVASCVDEQCDDSALRAMSTEHLPLVRARPDSDGEALIALPLKLRGRVGGALLLTRPSGAGFSDTDGRRAESVAAAAAAAIERTRTAVANRHREQWYAAGAEVAKEIVAGPGIDPQQLIVDRVAKLAQADSVFILQLGSTENSLIVVAATGLEDWVGSEFVAPDSVAAQVMATGRPVIVTSLADVVMPEHVREVVRFDSAAVVPLLGSGAQQGVIVVGRKAGKAPMSTAETGMATMFAGTVALALELAESQARRDELVLVEERDRIARDLHDHVIQRLYAIGLTVQNVANKTEGGLDQRLMSGVDEIDETIKQIRSTIFRLTTPLISSQRSLRARADALLDDLEPALGFRPRLVSNGPVDFGVDEDIIDDCDAVLREAVTNIARHAQATSAEVAISVSSSQLRLEIRDNGRGLGESTRRSGLANLRARAERHDGFMQVRSTPTTGTWMLWSIPVLQPGDELD